MLCSYAELIRSVWGDEAQAPHTRDDLARLAYDIRQKLVRNRMERRERGGTLPGPP